MSFMDRFESGLQKGLDVSRDLFEKARDKAKDLSDVGILKYEIRQLENQVEKLLGQLGSKVYKKFIEDKYDVEVFFIRKSNARDSEIQKLGELAGIPMISDSKHKHIIVYPKD